MDTPTPTYLDRLRADVAFADAHGPMQNHEPVTDSSLTYGDLREMLSILSEINAPLSDEEQTMIDLAWEKHKAAAPVAGQRKECRATELESSDDGRSRWICPECGPNIDGPCATGQRKGGDVLKDPAYGLPS